MQSIDRHEVGRLVAEEAAQLVEVLPAEEYNDEHLAGAVNIPLKQLGGEARDRLDPSRAVIVYCYDYQCDMSPRAAYRLESLGFGQVYDYVAGKADWTAAGLPTEGTQAGVPKVAGVAHEDVPRCRLDEAVAEVGERIGDWEEAVAVADSDVVLGVVRREALDTEPTRTVAEVLEEGPVTFRPDLTVAELGDHLRRRRVSPVLVTTSDGVLIGLLRVEDLEGDG